jgi:hypothetical protein
MRTRCEICGEELILSPTGHQWCADYTCLNGMGGCWRLALASIIHTRWPH